MTFPSPLTVPNWRRSPASSTTTTPSGSPDDRLNALLEHCESGTHSFQREREELAKANAAAQAATKQQQQEPAQQPKRGPLMSLLSLTRPREESHFDPSKNPKLHHLI
ncbi:hypothetical protein A1Q2_01578 [Trichosporon asahii var. asahii CBS 8904]|uniref:Uncharacterized protein n=2 Tax=Trichosporon asahii var. asahii TaxID=189963 RepID=K1W594_TRIAC|nr:hypothetical protein A1Q1_05128 [Trichosporon asahii var. asahii CBS 2479]EJT46299.1 hypothetical protein A1Q1_05128 [Trichosporon asahii var. asahii CBS 2479]EKD04103.1 hypothetical protein A1Q2_01578 [Trichosporon asahii var. asahii CBS 8904]